MVYNYQDRNENKSKFKSIPIPETKTKKSDFGKIILIPFFSGILGSSLVLGTCFGIPSIQNKFLKSKNHNIISSNNTSTISNGYIDSLSLENYSDSAIYAANKIIPSIVGIKIEYTINATAFFGFASASSVATASGSGIIISEDGYILTNNHVVSTNSSDFNSYYQISEATKILVSLFNDENEYEAKIVGQDNQTDLAVIKIEKTGLIRADFADSDDVKVGEFAMAVGNPVNMTSTVTSGIISAVNRKITDSDGRTYTCIQTDAAINSGNSGGALVNSKGNVIGINTLKLSGTGIEGIGFAIPINSTTDITFQLIKYNKVKRSYIGISGINLNEDIAKKYSLPTGIYVKSIENFSPAEKSGLKIGDVITEINNKKVKTMDELNEIKNNHKIGDSLNLKINRNGKEENFSITLGEQP